MKDPLISIVIPTKNSEKTLVKCLDSIKDQSFQDYELIIVDGFSKDNTRTIAKQYTDKILKSPGYIPAARNLGFSKAKGRIYVSIDSDMVLEKNLLEDIAEKSNEHEVLIIPEIGYGDDFLSKCKDLEKRCYNNDHIVEASRVFSKKAFREVNGYDPDLIFGEDWDLHLRIKKKFNVGRSKARLMHNTEHLSLVQDMKKAFKYGRSLPRYLAKGHDRQTKKWSNIKNPFFIRHFSKLKKEPLHGIGLFFIKMMEYSFGALGFLTAKIENTVGKND